MIGVRVQTTARRGVTPPRGFFVGHGSGSGLALALADRLHGMGL